MRQITKQNNQGNTSIYQKLHMNYKSMNAMANSFSISKEVADSLSATTSLAGSFAVTKAIADSFAWERKMLRKCEILRQG